MIDHLEARRLAAEAIDFALAPSDRIALDEHLEACPGCRAGTEQIGADALALAMLPTVDSQRDLRPSLAQAILGSDDAQPRGRPWFRSRTAVAVTAATLAVALIGGSLAWWSGRAAPGDETAGVGSATSPAPSHRPGSSAQPGRSAEPLGPPTDTASAATLEASGDLGGVVPLDASFRLTSHDGTPPSELATRVTIDPPVALTVRSDANGESARLVPSEPLYPGIVYRFVLTDPSGAPQESWAFQTSQPIHVVSTLPGNEAVDVPLRTGIEITFDQDGVTDAASHVSIEPAVKGRFEEHGRVLVFVPDRLAPATIYTVTVGRGAGSPATGQTLQEDVRFRFETAAKKGTEDRGPSVTFVSPLYESATSDRPIITTWTETDDDDAPLPVRLEAYRLPDVDAAIGAYRTMAGAPGWSQWSTAGVIPSAGLKRVLDVELRPQGDGPYRLRLPEAMPAGWYLVQHPGDVRPAQAILQVTDVAGYLATSTSRSLIWANDLATGKPLGAADVAMHGGDTLGTTDDHGLLITATPTALISAGSSPAGLPIVVVRAADGRATFLPAQSGGYFEGFGGYGDPDTRYWSLLHTDRLRYRPTDTVNVWGLLRQRDSGDIPQDADLRLSRLTDEPAARPPLASIPVRAGSAGVFTASIPLVGVGEGSYLVELRVGDRVVETVELDVGPIAKPAYQLAIETGHRVYVEGDRIKATVRATFFEGSSVPGVRLRIGGGSLRERTRSTDRTGAASTAGIAHVDDESSWETQDVYADPARAEEGEINGVSGEFLVFPSRRLIDAEGEVSGGLVRVHGTVHAVDVDRLERELDAGEQVWDVDPRGKPAEDATVTARFIELIPVRHKIGTEYDFIAKQVVPVYETRIVERVRGALKVKTRADGGFNVSLPTSSDHDYRVIVSVRDGEGHRAVEDVYAGRPYRPADEDDDEDGSASISPTEPRDTYEYGIGEPIDVTMRTSALVGLDRYLFYVAKDGLLRAEVGSSPRFKMTFDEAAVPNIDIFGVRFTGTTYQVAESFGATFRQSDRALKVDVTPRAQRYAPGERVTLDIRTRTSAGRPVPATVVLRAVDEKLFAIGAAQDVDTLSDLYRGFASGILDTYASHTLPTGSEGGDTGGGGGDERSAFADSLLFTAVDTDAQGRGVATFRLSDDLTSWHVSASAVTAGLQGGDGDASVPVGLPFFVDASIGSEYLTADRPSIRITAYGSDLAAGASVAFTVKSDSLGWHTGTIRGRAFRDVYVPLPRLSAGLHSLTITAIVGSGPSAMRDRLTRTFRVVDSRLTRTVTTFAELGAPGRPEGGSGLTSYVVSDAGRGRYLPMLLDLAADGGARLDEALAADLAREILIDAYDAGDADLGPSRFSSDRYQAGGGGVGILPYAGGDLQLSALVAIVAPDRFDRAGLERYLSSVLAGASETRERRAFALAGLAGLGSPVLPDIRAMATDGALTIRERLMLGIGAAALGDGATARALERSLADDYLERLGPLARLRVGADTNDITTATALMAVLAAWNGSAIASDLWEYVMANPASDQLHDLHAAAFVAHSLERLPAQPATFAYTLAGERHRVELDPGETFTLVVDRTQRATLTFEPLNGQAGLVATWAEAARPSDFVADPDVRISRTVTPSGRIDTGDLVRVDLRVRFAARAASGCRQVTDFVPSGLMPLGEMARWPDDDDEEEPRPSRDVELPYGQTGQRVYFCAEPSNKDRSVDLRYYARVVTPGRYVWEPAVAQTAGATDRAALTRSATVAIR